ncbi:cytochrome c oxidase assembly protein [Paenibacillus crassostreae]|uniref:Cytochrome c oxidase assembly protein n=1 Tax=Paenibacillus crassostreae TaxID=1763538 RepID=A0A167FP61_9BACL|nr:cytochrome c oxidase assembly protein [Paenibacillus crassostreae]AOZ94205.1 hypothetical protein LPB68_19755 [Paenibacillus crassostreae]OAB76759.1 hypothetical protein PNBC_04985 [Paenibacillus crassostreae]
MSHTYIHHSVVNSFDVLLVSTMILASIYYIYAAHIVRHNKPWPLYRTIFWLMGILCLTSMVVGPLAHQAHDDFRVHMLGHLLLGMLAPLLLVLSAPMTLALRTLHVQLARRISSLLKSSSMRILINPLSSSFLNVGGICLLYTTNLYVVMQHNIIVHLIVHIHVFLAGYLYTLSIIYVDPTPHRTSFVYRAVWLIISIAGHGILSKYIFAHPPGNVPVAHAETAGILMYYGGDAIEMVIIFILCYQWYKASRPRTSYTIEPLLNS